MYKPPLITITISVVIALISFFFGAAPEMLIYEKGELMQLQPWRWISAHLSHSDNQHLIWNLIGAVIVGWLLESRIGLKIIPLTLLAMMVINLYLIMDPQLFHYCGLSGVLNAWLALFLLHEITEKKSRHQAYGYLVLTGFGLIVKITIELFSNSAIFTATAWPAIPEVHVFGIIAALFFWAIPDKQTNFKLINNR